MRRLGIVTVITALLLPTWAHRAGAVQRLIDVRQIATDTLRDVALATFENGRPIIYYNPVLLQQFGPRLTSFFFAHARPSSSSSAWHPDTVTPRLFNCVRNALRKTLAWKFSSL